MAEWVTNMAWVEVMASYWVGSRAELSAAWQRWEELEEMSRVAAWREEDLWLRALWRQAGEAAVARGIMGGGGGGGGTGSGRGGGGAGGVVAGMLRLQLAVAVTASRPTFSL